VQAAVAARHDQRPSVEPVEDRLDVVRMLGAHHLHLGAALQDAAGGVGRRTVLGTRSRVGEEQKSHTAPRCG
jgi:hypothetical protein